MKKFTIDSYMKLSEQDKKKVSDWALGHGLSLKNIYFIEQVKYEDDPIMEKVKLIVWDLSHHFYIRSDIDSFTIYETDEFDQTIPVKYAEMEMDDFPWDVLV